MKKVRKFRAGFVVTMVTANFYAPGEALNVKKVVENRFCDVNICEL